MACISGLGCFNESSGFIHFFRDLSQMQPARRILVPALSSLQASARALGMVLFTRCCIPYCWRGFLNCLASSNVISSASPSLHFMWWKSVIGSCSVISPSYQVVLNFFRVTVPTGHTFLVCDLVAGRPLGSPLEVVSPLEVEAPLQVLPSLRALFLLMGNPIGPCMSFSACASSWFVPVMMLLDGFVVSASLSSDDAFMIASMGCIKGVVQFV